MTTYNQQFNIPFSASGDLSSYQYRFVMCATTAERVLLATGASIPAPIGVLQNDPTSGEAAQVCVMGVTQLWFSSSVAAAYGDFLLSGSDGGAEIAGAVAGSVMQAVALETMTAGSGYLKALVFPQYPILWDNTP